MAKHLPSLLRKAVNDDAVVEREDKPFFPVGLHVSDEELEKMQLGNAKLGEERVITGIVRVTSISANEREGGKKRQSVSLDMIEGITSDKPTISTEGEKATALFGSDA